VTWNRALWKPRKKSPNSIKAGEHHFIGPDGKRHQRRATDVCLPSSVARIDLDHMDRKQLQSFIDSRGKQIPWARRLFPSRPIHYPIAARLLYQMAYMKLADRTGLFEAMYRKLPSFAQWRSVFNPMACMVPASNMLDAGKRRKGR
jgi:hypothetical protein